MRVPILVLAAAFAVPVTATAEPYDYDHDYDRDDDVYAERDHGIRPETGVGFLIGTYSFGKLAGTTLGLHLDAGVRWHRLAALAEYDFLSFEQDTDVNLPVRGLGHRFAANVRYSFGVLSMRDFPVRGDFWIDVGAGREIMLWYDGGKLSRNDVSLGIGAQATVRFGAGKRRKLGLYYAIKFLVADRPDSSKLNPPGCAGPCDEPTPMIPIDVGIFFDLGVPFGT